LHAVNHLHEAKICHRNLKPENFLFETKESNAEVKIIDFGLSNKFGEDGEEGAHTVTGTPYYVAPEVLRQKYGKECDMWSVGVIMYVLLAGFPPFHGQTNTDTFRKILKGEFSFKYPEWQNISKEAKDLIKRCLTTDVGKRITAREAMDHVWFHRKGSTSPIDINILDRLRSYRVDKRLKREAMNVIVKFLSDEDIRYLTDTFRALDRDHTGYISA
jgi:calcium-dependent protein kinase